MAHTATVRRAPVLSILILTLMVMVAIQGVPTTARAFTVKHLKSTAAAAATAAANRLGCCTGLGQYSCYHC